MLGSPCFSEGPSKAIEILDPEYFILDGGIPELVDLGNIIDLSSLSNGSHSVVAGIIEISSHCDPESAIAVELVEGIHKCAGITAVRDVKLLVVTHLQGLGVGSQNLQLNSACGPTCHRKNLHLWLDTGICSDVGHFVGLEDSLGVGVGHFHLHIHEPNTS
jgi:hypothetical protein